MYIPGSWKLGAEFFRKEFILNYLVATYRKPQVSLFYISESFHGKFYDEWLFVLKISLVKVLNIICLDIYYIFFPNCLLSHIIKGFNSQWNCHGRWGWCFNTWQISCCNWEFGICLTNCWFWMCIFRNSKIEAYFIWWLCIISVFPFCIKG